MKFCKKCQIETDRYGNGGCKLCVRANNVVWKKANPEKLKAQRAAYRAANKDKARAYKKAYRSANKEKINTYRVKRNAVNRDKVNAYAAKWRAVNKDKVNASNARWNAANYGKVKKKYPESRRIAQSSRRARKLNAGGKHTAADIRELFTLQKGKCPICKASIKEGYHIDHIMPLSKGGNNDRLNIQLLCAPCNLQKNAKHPIDFMQSKGFLL